MNRLLFLLLILSWPLHAEVIHREKSLYRNIEVKESGSRRCLVFAVRDGDRNQTCMDLTDPDRVIFPYVRMTFAGLLLNPDPGSVLIVGLGGGTIPTILHQLYPNATIDIVEVDDAVRRVATRFFDFRESDGMTVTVLDARVFIKRARLKGRQYDLVVLDAFTGDYIPEHLMTMEFLEEVKAILSPVGVLVANTFSTSRLYDHESATYHRVFGDFYNFRMPVTGNRVIVAGVRELPGRRQIQSRANRLSGTFTRYRVNIEDFPRFMKTTRDWDRDARPLTDQFSPANLLRNR